MQFSFVRTRSLPPCLQGRLANTDLWEASDDWSFSRKSCRNLQQRLPPKHLCQAVSLGGTPLSLGAPLRMMLSSVFPPEQHCSWTAAMELSDSDPAQWTAFPAWPWTCLVTMGLPSDCWSSSEPGSCLWTWSWPWLDTEMPSSSTDINENEFDNPWLTQYSSNLHCEKCFECFELGAANTFFSN